MFLTHIVEIKEFYVKSNFHRFSPFFQYAGVKIGPVVKKDVMKASVMLEHEEKYTMILAFDVKVERDAQEMADSVGVKIFRADIIYHLFDQFTAYQENLKRQKREQFKNVAVFPCKLRVMPNFVFNSRDPIVCGVQIEAGIVRQGTPLCVPSKSVRTIIFMYRMFYLHSVEIS